MSYSIEKIIDDVEKGYPGDGRIALIKSHVNKQTEEIVRLREMIDEINKVIDLNPTLENNPIVKDFKEKQKEEGDTYVEEKENQDVWWYY